jgi:SAM-dependent methyltransferase
MEATLAQIDEPLIQALQLDRGYRIAEIGCGGGSTALAILQRAPAGSVVQGVDIAPALIEVARARSRNQAGVSFDVADVAATVPKDPYDRLVSRFGIMSFDDPPAAFTNLLKWLVPGGRFAFATWGRPADNPWMSVVREVVAGIVDIEPPDPAGPGPFRYASTEGLVTLLDETGFAAVDVRDWEGELPIGGQLSVAQAVDFALASFSSFAEDLARAGDEAFRQAREEVTARFSNHYQDDAVRMAARVHIFTGARPL